MDSLTAALDTRATDSEWAAITWDYGCNYSAVPPSQLIDSLTTDLLSARLQLDDATSASGRAELQRTLAQLAVFTAQTIGNLGHPFPAYRWWRLARTMADASGDPELRVWVRGREIIRGLYDHRPLDDVLTLADEARNITTTPGMGTGSVLMGRAQALALQGRSAEATAAVSEVYRALDRLPDHVTADTASMYGWPEYRLRHGESFVYTHAGDTRRAAEAQDRAVAIYPAHMFRERAQVQLHQALRLMLDGEPAEGVRHALETLAALPDAQRIEVVLHVARAVVQAVPESERHAEQPTRLRQLLSAPHNTTELRP
jgi:hypothetical protein